MGEMTEDQGVAFGPGHQPTASAADASSQSGVPNADALIAVMSAWRCLPGSKFHEAYPFFERDLARVIDDYRLQAGTRSSSSGKDYGIAVAILFAEYADALYAQAGVTRPGGDSPEAPVSEAN